MATLGTTALTYTVRTPGVTSDAETAALTAAQQATSAFQNIATTLKVK